MTSVPGPRGGDKDYDNENIDPHCTGDGIPNYPILIFCKHPDQLLMRFVLHASQGNGEAHLADPRAVRPSSQHMMKNTQMRNPRCPHSAINIRCSLCSSSEADSQDGRGEREGNGESHQADRRVDRSSSPHLKKNTPARNPRRPQSAINIRCSLCS